MKHHSIPFIVALTMLAFLLNGFPQGGAYATGLPSPNGDPAGPRSPLEPSTLLEQEFMLKVEIQIVSTEDLARLAALGFACPQTGLCSLDIPRYQLKALQDAGYEPQIVEQALVLRTPAGLEQPQEQMAADESSQYGINSTNINIPDYTGGQYCGYAYSAVNISGAPANAVVTRVVYSLRVSHTWVTDLALLLSSDQNNYSVLWQYNGNPSSGTDGGADDDAADDHDIELNQRELTSAFDGQPVNQGWYLDANDCAQQDTGYIDRFEVWIYYDTQADIRVSPQSLSYVRTHQSADFFDASAGSLMPMSVSATEREARFNQLAQRLEDKSRLRVIVGLGSQLPLSAPADLRQANTRAEQDEVLAKLGAEDFELERQFLLTPGFAGWVTSAGLDKLRSDPQVVVVEEDMQVHASLNQSVPLINADEAHALGFTGAGITVAVLDTGIDSDHPDLSDDLVAQKCYTDHDCPPNNTNTSDSAEDGDGHGTSVSGIITSRGTVAPLGVAPDAGIAAVKVLSDNGTGYMSDWIAGIDWAVANRDVYHISVINMSLGGNLHANVCDSSYPTAANAINSAVAHGITVFAASGNEASSTRISSPACISNAVSVGAVYDANLGGITYPGLCSDNSTYADKVTCYSNSNSLLDLLAPGTVIRTTGLNGGNDRSFGGTSAATPHAAGAAALVLSANPTLDPGTVKTRLKDSGVPVTDQRNNLVFPRINAVAAIQAEGFSIFNDGAFDLTITGIQALGGSCWLDIAPPQPPAFTIPAGSSAYVQVNIELCVASGSYNDTLRITSTDPDEPIVDIPVSLEMIGFPGIPVSPTAGLTTSESGGSATFSVSLATQPSASVTVSLSSSDTSEGTVSPSSLTFLPENWNQPRTVTIFGQDDAQIDFDVPFTILLNPASSADPNYNGWNPADVMVINLDNDAYRLYLPTTAK